MSVKEDTIVEMYLKALKEGAERIPVMEGVSTNRRYKKVHDYALTIVPEADKYLMAYGLGQANKDLRGHDYDIGMLMVVGTRSLKLNLPRHNGQTKRTKRTKKPVGGGQLEKYRKLLTTCEFIPNDDLMAELLGVSTQALQRERAYLLHYRFEQDQFGWIVKKVERTQDPDFIAQVVSRVLAEMSKGA